MSYSYDKNVYYNPEKHGLKVFDEVETAGSYEFDTTVVWKDENNKLYWAHDSGCSCPTPFENYGDISELNELTKETFHGFKEHIENQYNITKDQINEILTNVKKHLNI